jgi:hypothetical protein
MARITPAQARRLVAKKYELKVTGNKVIQAIDNLIRVSAQEGKDHCYMHDAIPRRSRRMIEEKKEQYIWHYRMRGFQVKEFSSGHIHIEWRGENVYA